MWGGVGRCGEVWGGMGRYGEVWGGMDQCIRLVGFIDEWSHSFIHSTPHQCIRLVGFIVRSFWRVSRKPGSSRSLEAEDSEDSGMRVSTAEDRSALER